MTAPTYTYGYSLATNLDKVRFYTGDRDTVAAMFSDEEITAMLVLYPDVTECSCELLESALSQYAHTPSTSTLGMSLGSERYQQCRDRLTRLRAVNAQRASTACPMTVGGTSIDDNNSLDADTTTVQPLFTTSGNDLPNSTPSSVNDNEETR